MGGIGSSSHMGLAGSVLGCASVRSMVVAFCIIPVRVVQTAFDGLGIRAVLERL